MPVPALIAQSVSAIYAPCKDLILYFKDETQHIKDLEERISDLVTNVKLIKSKKQKIDRSLRNSVYTEKTEAYEMMEENIKVVHNKCIKFVEKYTKITKNSLSSTSDDSKMINELENLKSKIWTFNFFKLTKLSRNIAKLNTRASEVRDILEPKLMIQNKSTPNQEKLDDNSNLPVFNNYVDKVLDCLCIKGNKVVGIFGPIGVGKTTVLKKLYNQLIEHKSLYHGNSSFQLDYVILTEYPQELGTSEMIVQKLQIEIMGQLNIDHEASNTSTQKNGDAISTFLSGKRYILLMDHVTFEIDLGKLGLKEHKYKKVVIASSDRKIINRMTDQVVEIQTLLPDEARTLFEIACGKMEIDGRKRDIAERIIECCAGIPWMIDNVAKHLSNKSDESSWNGVQQCLQSDSSSLGLIGLGGMDQVYKMIYEALPDSYKNCSLYGALFPIHYKIYRDYLIECWIAEGFLIKDDFKKVRRNRDHGQTILDVLTDRHLLNWCSDKMYVQMPLNFRRVALELDFPDSSNCVNWGPSNDREPDGQLWSRVKRMSLIGCNTKLPESPKCSNICTLLLQSLKPKLEKLAPEFFLDMENLQILDLNHTEIKTLPSSIDRVTKLKSLYLNDCNHLETLPPQAAKLVNLEFLDISETSISSLPEEIISCMVELRCLRASCSANSRGNEARHCFELIIPPGIISKLKKLEELSIVTTLDCEGGISVAKEMASLEHLHTLRFNFPNVASVDTFVDESMSLKNTHTSWKEHTFRSYKIFIGHHETDQHPYESVYSGTLAERWLRYSTDEEFSAACKRLLNQASAFELIGNEKVDSLSHFDMNSVKVCVVASCNKLKSIVDGYINSEKEVSSAPLELEKLYLYDLKLLQYICVGADHSQRLSNLTALTINGCPSLTKILDLALAHALESLQYLKVENCSEVLEIVEAVGKSEIVEVLEQAEPSHMLKSLRIIELTELPKLQSICNASVDSWNSLNSIIIISCPQLLNLSLSSENAKKLAVIECEQNLWDSLQIPDELNRQKLVQFCHFTEESSTIPEPSQMEKHQRVEDPIVKGLQAVSSGVVLAHSEEEITELNMHQYNGIKELWK